MDSKEPWIKDSPGFRRTIDPEYHESGRTIDPGERCVPDNHASSRTKSLFKIQ